MVTRFYINFSIKTPGGPKHFGHFNLGENKEEAQALFARLKGSPVVDYNDMLFIEFMEEVDGLPLNIDMITCDLQQLGINSMMITQEVFRLSNLKVK